MRKKDKRAKRIPVTDADSDSDAADTNVDNDVKIVIPDDVDSSSAQVVDVQSPSVDDAEAPATIETLQAKVDRLADNLLRAKADYKNLERRTTMERSDAIRFANTDLMRSLLEVLDDFERSLAVLESSQKDAAVLDGVRLIYDKLLTTLTGHGLERIEALHQPFDPNVHEALMMQPSEEHPAGTVIDEVARGYRLRDRVIRPARVVVASASKNAASEEGQPVETPAGREESS